MCLLTHPLLDAFTTYGTRLFWPLGDPVAISSIFIIDPLYTLPLLIAVVWALLRPPARPALVAGLTVSSLYLCWSLVAQQWMTQRVMPVLAEQGLSEAPRLVQPMPFSTLLWRVTVLGEQRRLEIVTGVLDNGDALTVETFPRSPQDYAEAMQVPAGRKLAWFTRGFMDVEAGPDQLLATDIRLGVPGLHPFQFVLAEQEDGAWKALPSHKLPRPMANPQAWPALLDRTLARQPILCLTTLEALPAGSPCPSVMP